MDAFIQRQVPDDADNVPLNLQGIPAQLINPLEELQASAGNDMVTVALDLRMTSRSSESTTFSHAHLLLQASELSLIHDIS